MHVLYTVSAVILVCELLSLDVVTKWFSDVYCVHGNVVIDSSLGRSILIF